jgi:hypothetical protein
MHRYKQFFSSSVCSERTNVPYHTWTYNRLPGDEIKILVQKTYSLLFILYNYITLHVAKNIQL